MYCPLCGAEYRPGFTECSDCQVALVPEPPRGSSADPPAEDISVDASFALVWSGSDARVHAEICEALESQHIPLRTLGTEDHLFNLSTRPAFEVYVPADLVNPAREAIKQVDAAEESLAPEDSDLLEIPAGEDSLDEEEERRDLRNLDPQDATIEIWSGPNRQLAAMMASSLRENHIPCRSDPDLSDPHRVDSGDIAGLDIEEIPPSDEAQPTRLFVFPEDERRAREIIREIIDAAPPE